MPGNNIRKDLNTQMDNMSTQMDNMSTQLDNMITQLGNISMEMKELKTQLDVGFQTIIEILQQPKQKQHHKHN